MKCISSICQKNPNLSIISSPQNPSNGLCHSQEEATCRPTGQGHVRSTRALPTCLEYILPLPAVHTSQAAGTDRGTGVTVSRCSGRDRLLCRGIVHWSLGLPPHRLRFLGACLTALMSVRMRRVTETPRQNSRDPQNSGLRLPSAPEPRYQQRCKPWAPGGNVWMPPFRPGQE